VIAVDTNVLLRYLLDDDAAQSRKARHLFDTNELILITDVVLVETIWTLKGKRYAAHKDDIAKIVMSLLEEVNVIFENRQAIWSALNDFVAASPVKTANGKKHADFSDALIVNKAKIFALESQQYYFGTYTFDLAALAIAGTKKV
jgi:predicted nucleic-acid-binding protein